VNQFLFLAAAYSRRKLNRSFICISNFPLIALFVFVFSDFLMENWNFYQIKTNLLSRKIR